MYKNKLEEEGTLFMKNLVAKADRSSRTTRTLGFGLALLLAGVSVASYSKVTKSVVRNTENKSSLTQAVKLGQAKVSGAVGMKNLVAKADRSSRTTRTLGFGLALLLAGVSVASRSAKPKPRVR